MVNQILSAAALISSLSNPLPLSNHPEGFVRKYLSDVKKSSSMVNPIIYRDISENEDKYLKTNFSSFEIDSYNIAAICPKNIVISAFVLQIDDVKHEICLASDLMSSKEIECDNIFELIKINTLDSKIEICEKYQ